MNWADWTITGIVCASALISLWRGFVRESISLMSWFGATVVALIFGENLAALLQNSIATPSLRTAVAYVILFVATLLVGALIEYLVSQLVNRSGLGVVDRLLGMVFGLARGAIVVVLLMMGAQKMLPVTEDLWWKQSRLIPHFVLIQDWAKKTLSEVSQGTAEFVRKNR